MEERIDNADSFACAGEGYGSIDLTLIQRYSTL